MGYNNTYPITLRYNDHKYCRLQLQNLEPEILIKKKQKIQLLLMKSDTSKLINLMLTWYQYVAGSPHLRKNSRNIFYINSFWHNDLVRLLHKHGVDINWEKKSFQTFKGKMILFL